jgi:prepilin-type N-terminal cleavage/methylation domain-containing protein
MKPAPPLRLRRAYTLVELLIVLAVLTTVIGLAVPSLRKLSERGYLQDAARQLRGQLLSARLQAIQSASNKFFFYQPDSGIYMVTGTDDAPSLDSSAGEELLVRDEVSEADAASGWDAAESAEQVLPSDVRFLAPGEPAVRVASAEVPTGGGGGQWSEPLIFYPNGRALNTRIRLASDRYWVELTVRGLTGTVQLSPVRRLEESPDAQMEGES